LATVVGLAVARRLKLPFMVRFKYLCDIGFYCT
jgi:hypothetical protein